MEINPSHFGIICMLFGASLSFFFYRANQKSDYGRISSMVNNLRDEYLLTISNVFKHQNNTDQHSLEQIAELRAELDKVKQDAEDASYQILNQVKDIHRQELDRLNAQFKSNLEKSKPELQNMINNIIDNLPVSMTIKQHINAELVDDFNYTQNSIHRYQVQSLLNYNNKKLDELAPTLKVDLMQVFQKIRYIEHQLDHASSPKNHGQNRDQLHNS